MEKRSSARTTTDGAGNRSSHSVSVRPSTYPLPGLGRQLGASSRCVLVSGREANASESSIGDASGVNTRPDSPPREWKVGGIQRPAANAVLTTVVDAWGRSWTPRCPSRSSGLIRRTAVDSRGPGHSLLKNGRSAVRPCPDRHQQAGIMTQTLNAHPRSPGVLFEGSNELGEMLVGDAAQLADLDTA